MLLNTAYLNMFPVQGYYGATIVTSDYTLVWHRGHSDDITIVAPCPPGTQSIMTSLYSAANASQRTENFALDIAQNTN